MATATLKWTIPTTRVDGSALAPSDVALIDVFDAAALDPATPITQIQGAGTEFTTDVLSVGPHGFTLVVQDTAGRRSDPSNLASVTVAETPPPPVGNPSPVTDLSATLNP